ncbi:MAG: hypothetical protein ABI418_09580, partial [Jatrophihabitantaceae bacterium]
AGRLAALMLGGDPAGAVQVSLRRPPPLDTELRVETSGTGLRAVHEGQLVAEAMLVSIEIAPVPPVDFETAADAATRFEGFAEHPFATCVGCGTDRADGLACYAGPIDPAVPTLVATPFVPRADLPRDPSLVWAALDCAGGWAIGLAGRRAVLGRMTAQVLAVPAVGDQCVIVAQGDGWDGRKAFSRSACYGADGRLLGLAQATWIELR